LCGVNNSRHICWSHTMKALGSLVTFVRRNSAPKVNLSDTCCDMKVWSRMFAMNVQSVSIEHLNWNSISQCTLTTDSSAVSFVTHSSNVKAMLSSTSRSVLQYTVSARFCSDYERCVWATTDYISGQINRVLIAALACRQTLLINLLTI